MPHQRRFVPLLWQIWTCSPRLSKALAAKARAASVESKDSADSKNSPQPQNATRPEGCVDLDCVAKYVRLNASALLDPDSLFIPLTTSEF